MRPGITVQHTRELSRNTELLRSDVTGFIGVVLPSRWPRGASKGDFFEMPIDDYERFSSNRARGLFDPVTLRGIEQFFANGGRKAVLFGLCIDSEQDLTVEDPFTELWMPLLERLESIEDVGIIAMPILAYIDIQLDDRGRATVPVDPTLSLLLSHCRRMNNRFLIIDTPRDLHDDELIRWAASFGAKNEDAASYGALYYPWLANGDDVFPPSGCVAGIYARVEAVNEPFGVRWPPANEVLEGVTHLSLPLKWRESDALVAEHINPILIDPARGVVVWGARTLSRDPKWMHINSRRIVSYLTEQIRRDSEWVVFENQRPELWEILNRQVTNRLDQLWSAGLLSGDQAGSEYLVKCDAENNPPEVRDAGQVHVEVMVRPIATAEFIVVDLRLGG